MIDGLFASANYQGVKKMLDATVLRQEAIASNLANIETPNYKRVDVAPALRQSCPGRSRKEALVTCNSSNPPYQSINPLWLKTATATPCSWRRN